MIPKECKRLAEVDFPIAVVSKHAAREKSIRHGHPSPCISGGRGGRWRLAGRCCWRCSCPIRAIRTARKSSISKRAFSSCVRCPADNPDTADNELRKALLKFIADFASWTLAANRTYLDVSRALVKAAHGEEPPLVVDPFAGGGSIPLAWISQTRPTFIL